MKEELSIINSEIDTLLKNRDEAKKGKEERNEKILIMSEEAVKDILSQKVIEAIKQIKIEPKIFVSSPEVILPKQEVILKEIRQPEIKIPTPIVQIQERPFPKQFQITGFIDFVKGIVSALKGKLNVGLEEVSPQKPLYVVLTHGGKVYKAGEEIKEKGAGFILGGSSSKVSIRNKTNQIVSPLSEAHDVIEDGNGTVTTAGVAVQLPNIPCKKVKIICSEWNGDMANCPNGGLIAVGSSSVAAALATRRGSPLFPTQSEWFMVSNLNLLYIDSMDNGAKYHYIYEN